jgi:NAD(P)-dependent dehydrogenase (short-subunit alcohol dehydrogenase family)
MAATSQEATSPDRGTAPGRSSAESGPEEGAVEVLTGYMAKEPGARGIAVNTVASGAIETDFGGGAVRDSADVN